MNTHSNTEPRICSTPDCTRPARVVDGRPRSTCNTCQVRARRHRAVDRDLAGKSLDELREIARSIGATHAPKAQTAGVTAAIRARRAELSLARTGLMESRVVAQRAQQAQLVQQAQVAHVELDRWLRLLSACESRALRLLAIDLGIVVDDSASVLTAKKELARALADLGSDTAAQGKIDTAMALKAAEDAARAAYVPPAPAPGELDGVELKADRVYWPRSYRDRSADRLPLPLAVSRSFAEQFADRINVFEVREGESLRDEQARELREAVWQEEIGEIAGLTLAMFDDLQGKAPEYVRKQIEDVRREMRLAREASWGSWELTEDGGYAWVTASGMRLAVGQDRYGKRAWWWKIYVDAGKGPNASDYIASGHAPNKHEAKLCAFRAHVDQLRSASSGSFDYAKESKAQKYLYKERTQEEKRRFFMQATLAPSQIASMSAEDRALYTKCRAARRAEYAGEEA